MSAVLCVHEVYVSEKECCVAELCVFTCEQGYIGGLPVETVRETPPAQASDSGRVDQAHTLSL